jgi:hypothetical protein
MQFLKTDNIYKIKRITGSQDNILGISFAEKNTVETDIKVIKWDFPNIDGRKIPTSEIEILKQVLLGLKSINKSLETDYKLSKIYFSPWDSAANEIYGFLIAALIRHYHNGKEFQ